MIEKMTLRAGLEDTHSKALSDQSRVSGPEMEMEKKPVKEILTVPRDHFALELEMELEKELVVKPAVNDLERTIDLLP
nr:hypothetical protein Iba_chr06dCG2740 [Ipomoea batatas]GMD10088.1 hypothetical protein Iba_chr06eCG2880 [Ipomoea batatas]GMD11297.1 hypothetical protein Iba_chr06fCG2370 [Ipomoea batatas]